MTTLSPVETDSLRRQVLIVDDEPDMLNMLKLVIQKSCDCDVIIATSGTMALKFLETVRPDVVVTDIKMPDLDGLQLLQEIRTRDKSISVVVMTGYGTIEMAVQALKDGAYDFLQKPFDKDHIIRVVQHCLERTALLRTNRELQEQLRDLSLPEGFVGQSPALKRALDLIARIANTDATVLIRGESGTGKEVAARALHSLSNRKKRPMVTVNCPALPEHILESELFGYSRGAFTGALHDKKGLFLEADGSTILLDEIADIPVSVQTKLLRVLQEKEIQPLGQNKTIKLNARVVASTNQDLEAKIKAGEFREDLYYRLNVVTINMPSLEEMREDIPLLVHHYLSRFKQQYNREDLTLSSDILQHLYTRSWPGNVRELRNIVKRLVLLGAEGGLDIINTAPPPPATHSGDRFTDTYCMPYNDAKAEIVKRFSESYLRNLLQTHEGNVTNAAAACNLDRQGLQRIMRRYGILSTDFKQK